MTKSVTGNNKNRDSSDNSSRNNTRKGDLNSFLRERFETQKQMIEREMLIKQAQDQKILLESEIKSVEKLRNAFTDLLPKVIDSIKIIDCRGNNSTAEKNNIMNSKNYRFQESEINKNTNLNINTFTNSNLKTNPVTLASINKPTPSSKRSSNRDIVSDNSNYSKGPAYGEEIGSKNYLFYNPKKNYFVRNKYKKLLQ